MSPEIKPWPVVSSNRVISTRIFDLRTDRALNPRTGRAHDFTVLESTDWVNVIALTPAREMVLIRQYRFGTGQVTLEIPGGLIDPGDTPAGAAVRELQEETGFRPGRVREIGRVRPNPAFLNNTCYTFLVEDALRDGPARLEPAEDIAVELAPLEAIPELVRSGRIDHALVLNAFFWLLLADLRPAG